MTIPDALKSIRIRTLAPDEFPRLAEMDRTERIRVGYRIAHGELEKMDVQWDTARWTATGPEHSVEHYVQSLQELSEANSVTLGAFDGDRLIAVATWRPNLTEEMDQLAVLHVSHGYRRRGIAGLLCDRLETFARENGAGTLYVSATPSGSAVGFYRSRGFRPAAAPHPELLALEPDDIHMTKVL